MKIPKVALSLISVVFAALFVMTLVSPYLNSAGHGIRNSWVVYSLWLLTTFFWKQGALSKTLIEVKRRKYEVISLISWLMVVMFNAILERGYTWDLHFWTMLTMGMVIFMQLSYSAQRDGSGDALLMVIVVMVGLEVLISLPTLWSQPALARIVMGADATPEMIAAAGAASVGQYGYYTGLAIVLPVIVSQAIVSSGQRSILMWFIVGVIALAIAISTFMGAILLMLLGFLILFLFYIKYATSKIKILILYGMLGLIFFTIWATILSNTEQGSYIEDKVTQEFTGIAAAGIEEGDVTGRSDVWRMSFNTFLEYPLFGVGPSTNRENPNLYTLVGGHSSWLDQLAEYGVMGFGFYILFIGLAIRRITKSFILERNSRDLKIRYLGQLVSCVLFIFGGTYNPVIVVTEVFVLFYFMSSSGAASYEGRRNTSEVASFKV